MKKKACVIFPSSMKKHAEDLGVKLTSEGYDPCLTEAPVDIVAAAKQGETSITLDIEACLMGASVKIFLIPFDGIPSGLLGAAGKAIGTPGRLIAVYAKDAVVPEIFGEVANSVIPVSSPNVIKAITSLDLHEGVDNAPKPPKPPVRVKCQ